MKKKITCLLALMLFSMNVPVFAMSDKMAETIGVVDSRVQPEQPADAPKWIEYVPDKYQNPRTDFSKGKAIAELSAGIVLTDLLITAPIGVPMITHATTKLKNIGWADKKVKFFKGLEEANKISNAEERAAFYKKLRTECKMTDLKHAKQLKRMAKAKAKAK